MQPAISPASVDGILSSRRILVLGPSGAGKTFLTLRLADLLSREPIHLDAHFWKSGWVSTPQPEWRETVAALTQRESWIMDGTYESTLEFRIVAADAVVIVDTWALLRLYRVLVRRFGGGDERRPDAPPGQRIDASYLRYIFGFARSSRPLIANLLARHGAGKSVLTLSGRHAVERFLRQVEARVRGGTRSD